MPRTLEPAGARRRCSPAARSRRCWASSTTPSSSAPAGSSLGQLALAVLAVAAGITVTLPAQPVRPGQSITPGGPFAVGVHGALDRGDDQQHQLHRRARRAVVGHRADRRRDAGADLADDRRRRSRSSAILCFALAGALLGFLRWNFHPASIFIGTSGVMFVGYTLAVLSILGTAKVAVALLVLGVPIIDTFWIIVRRARRRAARRSRRTAATSTTGCSTSACRTARRCW